MPLIPPPLPLEDSLQIPGMETVGTNSTPLLVRSGEEEHCSAPPFRPELTFGQFMMLPFGPDTLPITLTFRQKVRRLVVSICAVYTLPMLSLLFANDDTEGGMILLTSLFQLFLILIVPPIAWWRYYRKHGALKTLEQQTRIGVLLVGSDIRTEVRHLYKKGLVYEIMREPEKALECYLQIASLPLCNKHPGGAPYHSRAGQLLFHLGRYEEALESLETCLTLRKKQKKTSFVHRCLRSDLYCIGQTHERLGNLEEALKVYQEAYSTLQGRGYARNVETATSLVRIGSVYAAMGKLEESLEHYERARDIHLLNFEFPYTESVALLYEAIGDVYARKEGPISGDKAVKHYNLAADAYRRSGKSDKETEIKKLSQKIADVEAYANAA